MKSERAVPTRYLRSQQAKQAKAAEATESAHSKCGSQLASLMVAC